MEKFFENAFEYKVIYITGAKGEYHKGYLKVGDATLHTNTPIDQLNPNSRELNQAALLRINSYMGPAGLTPDLKHTELAVKYDKEGRLEAFRDYQVQKVLKNSGYPHITLGDSTGIEWFEIDPETAKKAIKAVKTGHANLSNSGETEEYVPIVFRPEQEECIKKVREHFKIADRFLINAKMRYGKTLVTLQIVKECGFRKTIILTHRPVVDDGWYEDFKKIFYGTDYVYGSKKKGNELDQLETLGKPYIYFASIQDLRGSKLVGGLFDKNGLVFATVWDCVIVDEAHEGTTTALGEDTVKSVVKAQKGKTKFLALSGTPFNIISNYEDDAIYTWDYVMEQECKSEWDKYHFGDSNPYEDLPKLKIYTYSLGELLDNKGFISFEDKAFNFREFFRTFTGDIKVDHDPMPSEKSEGDFVHEDDVWSFLNLMVKDDGESQYPFSTVEYQEIFKHTLWMVPGVKEAKALKKLMMKHPVFGNGCFDVINVAGSGDEEEGYEEALGKVKDALVSAKKTGNHTITLSCGKLTTGVTVKEWTGVFMLSGSYSTSAANYLQTIFRVQSPCNTNGKIKETAYVFDFAPDRTLRMVSKAAAINTKKGKSKVGDKKILGKFLNYMPVISIEGSDMEEYNATRLLQQIKNVYAEKVVASGFEDNALYNDELLKLTDVDIQAFNELKDIIGKNKAQRKTEEIKVNAQGLTDEEYEEQERLKKRPKKVRTPEEEARLKELQEKNKLRKTARDILNGISVRMPMLIYGADVDYDNDISLDSFVNLVDEESWKEFMPRGVTKRKFKEFQKYYDEEVFIAAGRKIRYIAREADKLDPEERVKKIALLFSCFKNPDKETVLTPWRVVNLHMSETLGGWDFFDEKHEGTIEKPRFVDRGEITEKTFNNCDTQVLEINSKTGLYPLYVAYSIYRSRLDKIDTKADKKVLWNKVLEENVFIICKTPMAKAITRRTLAGYSNARINAHCFDDLTNTLKNKSKQFMEKILRPTFWGKKGNKMKISAIIGNPPYQEETAKQQSEKNGQARRKSIFHYFQIASDQISSRYISLIYPGARWIHRSGKGMESFGLEQINDRSLEKLIFFPNSRDIFPDVDISDGISIVMKDKCKEESGFEYIYYSNGETLSIHRDNPGTELMPLNPNDDTIVKKVSSFVDANNLSYLFGRVMSQKLFGIESTFVEDHIKDVREYREGDIVNYDSEVKLFTNDKSGPAGRSKWFVVNRADIPSSSSLIDEWQVVVSSAHPGGQEGRDNQIEIIDNHSAFGRARVALGSFKTLVEAQNFYKYAKSSFVKFMFLMTDESLTSFGKRTPDLGDYTNESKLVDFGKPIDEQMYRLTRLSEEEISYIEDTLSNLGKSENAEAVSTD